MKNITNGDELDLIPESNLTPLQQKAVFSLLSCRTVEQAAKEVGVTSRALFYWLNDIEFQAEMHAAQSAILNQSANALVGAQSNILEKLENLVNSSTDEKIVIEAGKVLLEYVVKWYELSRINSKLNRIEALLEDREHE